MMDELISKQQAIDALEKWLHSLFGITEADGTATIFKTIRQLPPIQPKRGKWIYSSYDDESGFDESWTCNKCGYMTNIEETNFCPNCGADMRGERRE